MINRFFFLFLTTAFVISSDVTIASSGFYTHTSHTPIELKPAFLNPEDSFQIASVCFMGVGCGGDAAFNKGPSSGGSNNEDFEIDTKKQCQNEGFTITSCPSGSAAHGICPHDSHYYQSCVSIEEACKKQNYNTVCGEGLVLDPSQSCDYDSQYKKCICNPCTGYAYTLSEAIADGYMIDGEPCDSCGELKYKRQTNDCKGFLECECGGEIGTETCMSGTTQKFAVCKTCYHECTNGETDITNYWCEGKLKCFFKP